MRYRALRLAEIGFCVGIGVLIWACCIAEMADEPATPTKSSASGNHESGPQVMTHSSKGVESRIEEDGIAVVISESGKTLYGYSAKTGNWDRVRVQNPDGRQIYPLVGGGVACAVVGTRAYGFSGTTGRWDVVEITPGRVPVVSRHFCCVDDGSKIYTFSNSTGRWSMADMSQDDESGATSFFGDVEHGKEGSALLPAIEIEKDLKQWQTRTCASAST